MRDKFKEFHFGTKLTKHFNKYEIMYMSFIYIETGTRKNTEIQYLRDQGRQDFEEVPFPDACEVVFNKHPNKDLLINFFSDPIIQILWKHF